MEAVKDAVVRGAARILENKDKIETCNRIVEKSATTETEEEILLSKKLVMLESDPADVSAEESQAIRVNNFAAEIDMEFNIQWLSDECMEWGKFPIMKFRDCDYPGMRARLTLLDEKLSRLAVRIVPKDGIVRATVEGRALEIPTRATTLTMPFSRVLNSHYFHTPWSQELKDW